MPVTIYVPRSPVPQSLANIKPGSALVGLASAERSVVFYEGNVYGADNLRTFARRLNCAAGRLETRYPTIARLSINNEDLVAVGTVRKDITSRYWVADNIHEPDLLQTWLGSDPLRDVFEHNYPFIRARH